MDLPGAFGAFSATYGLLAIFALMLVKEIGVPVPIPSDLLMIAAGVQVAAGAYSPVALLLTLAIAVLVGGSIQFVVARSAGRAVVYRLAGMVGIGADRMDRAVARLGAAGPRGVFVGLNIPGARAAVVPAAGLARLAFGPFTIATVAGSLAFYGWHVALGYAAGPAAAALVERSSAALIGVLAALALVGLVAWLALRRRERIGGGEAARSWTDAACPACLAITAIARPGRSAE